MRRGTALYQAAEHICSRSLLDKALYRSRDRNLCFLPEALLDGYKHGLVPSRLTMVARTRRWAATRRVHTYECEFSLLSNKMEPT